MQVQVRPLPFLVFHLEVANVQLVAQGRIAMDLPHQVLQAEKRQLLLLLVVVKVELELAAARVLHRGHGEQVQLGAVKDLGHDLGRVFVGHPAVGGLERHPHAALAQGRGRDVIGTDLDLQCLLEDPRVRAVVMVERFGVTVVVVHADGEDGRVFGELAGPEKDLEPAVVHVDTVVVAGLLHVDAVEPDGNGLELRVQRDEGGFRAEVQLHVDLVAGG